MSNKLTHGRVDPIPDVMVVEFLCGDGDDVARGRAVGDEKVKGEWHVELINWDRFYRDDQSGSSA